MSNDVQYAGLTVLLISSMSEFFAPYVVLLTLAIAGATIAMGYREDVMKPRAAGFFVLRTSIIAMPCASFTTVLVVQKTGLSTGIVLPFLALFFGLAGDRWPKTVIENALSKLNKVIS